jgi:hypothetical protein
MMKSTTFAVTGNSRKYEDTIGLEIIHPLRIDPVVSIDTEWKSRIKCESIALGE